MEELRCMDCFHFKTRVVRLKDIGQYADKVKKNELAEAWPCLGFPLTLQVVKEIVQYGFCDICYCLKNNMRRDVYVRGPNSSMAIFRSGEKVCQYYDGEDVPHKTD